MLRRLLSVLALLLLVLAAQAVAGDKGDKGDDKGDDGSDDRRERERRADSKGETEGRQGDRDKEDEDDEEDVEDEGDDDGGEHAKDQRRERKAGRRDTTANEVRTRGGRGSLRDANLPNSPGLPSDAALTILPTALPGRAQFSFLASSVAAADGITLQATLPETGSPWTISGPSAASCRLAGRALECFFEGLAPGDVRLVQAASPIGRAPPWELAAEGAVVTPGDAAPGNDHARAGLGLLLA